LLLCYSVSLLSLIQVWLVFIAAPLLDCQQLNSRWQVRWESEQWRVLWRQLLGSWGHPRTTFLIWRIFHYGFFTQSGAYLWKICTAACPICSVQDESFLQLFFQCSRGRDRWKRILFRLWITTLTFNTVVSPMDFSTVCDQVGISLSNKTYCSCRSPLVHLPRRNCFIYQENSVSASVSVILNSVLCKLKVISKVCGHFKLPQVFPDQSVSKQSLLEACAFSKPVLALFATVAIKSWQTSYIHIISRWVSM
jgi:hypothetical protein